jgi:Mg/Co/Ni transporter MgtE
MDASQQQIAGIIEEMNQDEVADANDAMNSQYIQEELVELNQRKRECS